MTSGDPRRVHDTARTFLDYLVAPPRVSLKPPGAAKGHFDGGWWPRSREPVAEFSALVDRLSDRFGPVDRIGYNPVSWDLAPARLVVAADTVRLAGFRGLNRHTVILIGPDLPRLTLLVVPATVAKAVADATLALVASAANTDDAAALFAAGGVATTVLQ
ncbi:DUF5994 family protein [Actinokineospora sp.]|uniref:DUF5994 family protein n=1 Tax=Actinokineospora sp. TaxID=1872133 RepID=UPI0040381528